jgi:hypothetical protein
MGYAATGLGPRDWAAPIVATAAIDTTDEGDCDDGQVASELVLQVEAALLRVSGTAWWHKVKHLEPTAEEVVIVMLGQECPDHGDRSEWEALARICRDLVLSQMGNAVMLFAS